MSCGRRSGNTTSKSGSSSSFRNRSWRSSRRTGQALLPKRLTVSVLFTDIRGFTGLSERLNPAELSELLNRHYFSPLDNIIFRHNGTLDKHIGDSIMGIFGAPVGGDDDACRAVLAALAMREEIAGINEGIAGGGAEDLRRHRDRDRRGDGRDLRFPAEEGVHRLRRPGQPCRAAGASLPGADQILICGETARRVEDLVQLEKMDIPGDPGTCQVSRCLQRPREKIGNTP